LERRTFLHACALAAAGCTSAARGKGEIRSYGRALLVDAQGDAFKTRSLVPHRNYVFNYPYVATPCFLLDLGKGVSAAPGLELEDGSRYDGIEGVGRRRSIVAFSAICAHKLAYPTRDISFIRYQSSRSERSDAERIHCCAEHSVYDPARGARVMSGPARQPLAGIVLEYDAANDQLYAVGTTGGELFDAFFAKYDFKLAMEYGASKAREPAGPRAVLREMTAYCRQTIEC
jgi:Rieske Fe-S protein